MNSSDSAEAVVKLSLEGMEVALRIAGSGAKNIAVMIYTIMKDQQQTKGKTRLTSMIKTGKPLKIFTIRAEDLKKFSQEAKKYGVLYCALADKKNQKIDGMVDIMVREEDAAKINRIAERFNFGRTDIASVKQEFERELKNAETIEKSEEDKFLDDILTKPEEKEIQEQEISPSNLTEETTEKSQSENFYDIKQTDKKEFNIEKKSVREELKIAKIESKEKELEKFKLKNMFQNKKPKHLLKDKETRKGKRYKKPKHMEIGRKKKRAKGRSK